MGYTVSRQQAKAFSSFVDPSALGIVFMAVAPHHQRQGVGSTLLKMLCDYVDEYELDIFIISSPDGIRVYSKF